MDRRASTTARHPASWATVLTAMALRITGRRLMTACAVTDRPVTAHPVTGRRVTGMADRRQMMVRIADRDIARRRMPVVPTLPPTTIPVRRWRNEATARIDRTTDITLHHRRARPTRRSWAWPSVCSIR